MSGLIAYSVAVTILAVILFFLVKKESNKDEIKPLKTKDDDNYFDVLLNMHLSRLPDAHVQYTKSVCMSGTGSNFTTSVCVGSAMRQRTPSVTAPLPSKFTKSLGPF